MTLEANQKLSDAKRLDWNGKSFNISKYYLGSLAP